MDVHPYIENDKHSMATQGFFTLDGLYAGKAKEYYQKTISFLAFTSDDQSSLISTANDDESTTTEITENVYKVIRQNSFAYFHWLLIALAVFLTVLLSIIAIYFCCQHCTKKNKRRT
jgi:hypothetical protein